MKRSEDLTIILSLDCPPSSASVVASIGSLAGADRDLDHICNPVRVV